MEEKLSRQELLVGAQRDLLRCEEKLRRAGCRALGDVRETVLLAVGDIQDVAEAVGA